MFTVNFLLTSWARAVTMQRPAALWRRNIGALPWHWFKRGETCVRHLWTNGHAFWNSGLPEAGGRFGVTVVSWSGASSH